MEQVTGWLRQVITQIEDLMLASESDDEFMQGIVRGTVAQCEAHLAILDEHRTVIADRGGDSYDRARNPGYYRIVHEHPTEKQVAEAGFLCQDAECRACRSAVPCRTVCLLASGYRNCPGYDESWSTESPA